MEEGATAQDWPITITTWLEASALGVAMRDSVFLYPVVNVIHLIGLVMIVGAIGLLDLRMLGMGRQVPLAAAYPVLTRAAALGVLVQVASGICLFAAEATTLLDNEAFGLKMLLFAIALGNAGAFRLLWRKRVDKWDRHPPFLGLAQAALSLFLWLAVAVLGRLIAYV